MFNYEKTENSGFLAFYILYIFNQEKWKFYMETVVTNKVVWSIQIQLTLPILCISLAGPVFLHDVHKL